MLQVLCGAEADADTSVPIAGADDTTNRKAHLKSFSVATTDRICRARRLAGIAWEKKGGGGGGGSGRPV